jgi:hypothetical protein
MKILKLTFIVVLGIGFFLMDKNAARAKEFSLYAMGYATCAGLAIGYLGGIFQKHTKKE